MKKSKQFEIIARAIVVNHGKVLLCKLTRAKWWFFPGGHVEFQEAVEDALRRELKEETGMSLKKEKLIGIVENVFTYKGLSRHEINLVFKVSVRRADVRNLENHLQLEWKNIKGLDNTKILPDALKRGFIKWLKDKKFFWGSNVKRGLS